MEFFKTLTLPQVLAHLTDSGITAAHFETVSLLDALGRIAASDCLAPEDMPMFDRSTVDGYAIIGRESAGASEAIPGFFQLAGESLMGEAIEQQLQSGQAVYVPTGGMLPPGADAMVMIEFTEKMDHETLLVYKPSPPGAHISYRGDDVRKGDIVVAAGRRIDSYDIGMLAGAGYDTVCVYRKPKVAVISTGDEVRPVGEPITFGQIYDVNGYTISARLLELGCDVVEKALVSDNYEMLRETVETSLAKADIVILSGGSSVGTRDFTARVIESFEGGRLITHGIAIKPGKPTIVGKIDDKFIIGLPGHPASALIIFNAVVKPLIYQLMPHAPTPFVIEALLSENVHASPGKDTFQMVQLYREGSSWHCKPIYAKSGMMSLLATASGYIHMTNEKEGLSAGTAVDVYLLQEVRL
ncbi:molybdopterin molybdotransferase MoeA [Fusibacter paucivorans]|uniref:Molybdopterin molybdenumtransferase n=1 Tax=Fusibacter paucivorans TaxID=76009 RepID=A0ABS5PLF4_9FIRM|nr:gephyrin-like molybdotransferase Glp [Fusibacter paucivorans]MBS7525896.1 molybdopterin molybdotransferase MoeA [Fusibacter paucivorans]